MKNWVRANKGFLLFLMLFGIFRTAVADWNPIPSASMHPNLLEGDVVFVNRLAYNVKVPLTDIVISPTGEPQRGDIVTFSSPVNGTRLIKRVIALPGDRVEMRNEQLIINGQPAGYSTASHATENIKGIGELAAVRVDESLGDRSHAIQFIPQINARRNFDALVVPPGQYMMLGDNRDNSEDSRYIGLVPRALLIGRAERVLASADITGSWMPRAERFGMSLYPKQ
ncbi:signal peptidase I [Duganella sp. CF402]|uniref:signal peptidase I n=1 Tax=unclassified Duganella TaxID=2636909 RepID=UPI0008C48606|nr:MULTISPECIES: signal peptidase I [unclassified Duganella]RZT04029.1 signal peptidase I [Duganella sp. BK701]SEM50835.1 signal peptidase I [Duganella sp. CF402]